MNPDPPATGVCSDKTGTLTQNKLKLYEPIVVDSENLTAKDLTFYAALAAKRMEEGQDAIDLCVTNQNNTDSEYAKKIETYVRERASPEKENEERSDDFLQARFARSLACFRIVFMVFCPAAKNRVLTSNACISTERRFAPF